MFPPMLLHLRVTTAEQPRFGIWLPLFLVWLILLPIVALAFVITMLVDIALMLAGQSYHHYTLLLVHVFEVLGATRGTTVHVHSDRTIVEIDLV